MAESADARPVLLRANGTEYRLAFGLGALRRLETRSGRTFGEVAGDLDRQSFAAMTELLRAALEREHGLLDDEAIDAIVDEAGFGSTAQALTQTIERDFSPANPPEPESAPGTISSETPSGSA